MKVLVGCDGSIRSEQALGFAAGLPLEQPDYYPVNVAPLVEIHPEVVRAEAREEIDAFNEKLDRQGHAAIDRAARILADAGFDSKPAFVRGDAVKRLVEMSADYDLLVTGSRGLNPVQSFFLGSVSDAMIRSSHCPVLLYRCGSDYQLPSGRLRIAFGHGNNESSAKAFSYLQKMDLSRVESISLISVMQMNYHYGMSYSLAALEDWPEHKATLEESLVELQKSLEEASGNAKIRTDIVTDSYDIANTLNNKAKEHRCNLIMAGCESKNFMDRVILGSTSNKLAHHADMPVLIVR